MFGGGEEGYFIANTDGKTVRDKITLISDLTPYEIDLYSGETCELIHERCGDAISFDVELLRGEAIMIFLSSKKLDTKNRMKLGKESLLAFDRAFIGREYSIDEGPRNDYFTDGERPIALRANTEKGKNPPHLRKNSILKQIYLPCYNFKKHGRFL